MGAQAKKKTSAGTSNDRRRNGKAWKDGKSPEVRHTEASKKAEAKRTRKASHSLGLCPCQACTAEWEAKA